MATINNIKKRAAEIKNAYEPESVTAEKVGKLFEDIADVTEQAIASSEEVMQESVRASEQAAQAAEDASGYLADLQEAIADLPDGQAVTAQVAVNQTDITGLKSKTDSISKQSTQSEEVAIIYETDGGVQVGKIGANGADFTNLKRGGQQVARMSDLPTKDNSIGDNPSNTHVPTTKAVKEYVDANAMGDLPLSEESTQSDDEEFVASNNAGTDTYAKVGAYGVKAKAYKKLNGDDAIPPLDTTIGDNPSNSHTPSTQAVKNYVDSRGGGVGDLPISEESTQSEDEEFVASNDAGTDTYVKMGPYGVKAKAFKKMDGTEIGGSIDYRIFDQAFIKGGKLICNNDHQSSNTVAKYTYADMGSNVVKVLARCTIKGGSLCILNHKNNSGHPISDITSSQNGAAHFVWGLTTCTAGFYYPNKQNWRNYYLNYASLATDDETEYECGYEYIGNNKVRIYLPKQCISVQDVNSQSVQFEDKTDASGRHYVDLTIDGIDAVNGRYVCWEHYTYSADTQELTDDFNRWSFTGIYCSCQDGIPLVDNFKRNDGAIGTAPSGHVYKQNRNTSSNSSIYDKTN